MHACKYTRNMNGSRRIRETKRRRLLYEDRLLVRWSRPPRCGLRGALQRTRFLNLPDALTAIDSHPGWLSVAVSGCQLAVSGCQLAVKWLSTRLGGSENGLTSRGRCATQCSDCPAVCLRGISQKQPTTTLLAESNPGPHLEMA